MVYADLHVHTDRSDGSMAPEEVPAAARAAGVSVVALTDHDLLPPFEGVRTVRPGERVPGTAEEDGRPGGDETTGAGTAASDGGAPDDRGDDAGAGEGAVDLVAGVELRVEVATDLRVDLLGYGVTHTDALATEVERIQRDRLERGRAIIDCVEDRLGVDLGVEPHRGMGRPHVARAVDAHPDVDLDYEGAFRELIGDGQPCYRAREVPGFETGRRVLEEACGLVGLAHPLRYGDPGRALSLTADLDAVEVAYPYGHEVDLAPVEAAVEEHDLVATGGSDAHDDRLGLAGLDREEYEPVRLSVTQG
jgi:predicted metal-dependent phosphoesterase TrpH